MTRFDWFITVACASVLTLMLCVSYFSHPAPHPPPVRFLWIGNPANVETWNGACLDLETRQIVRCMRLPRHGRGEDSGEGIYGHRLHGIAPLAGRNPKQPSV